MIPFDFEYYRPDTIKEAVDAFGELDALGKHPVYYGGGSELISMARIGNQKFGAVIDIKGIPEAGVLETDGEHLHLGAALTLSEITESKKFPLMEKAAGRVADHTMQCKITLGGNIAGTIMYRETVLPLLLAEAKLTIAGPYGIHEYEISSLFHERLTLQEGEFLVKASVAEAFVKAPYFHFKKTKNEKIDYPLVTTAGCKTGGLLRIAFSGLAAYPFRDSEVERILNDGKLNNEEKAETIAASLSGIMMTDTNGSAEYRSYVLKNTVLNVLQVMRDV
jgi:CO/xanthine dehydrogenase FAD-binding subunit